MADEIYDLLKKHDVTGLLDDGHWKCSCGAVLRPTPSSATALLEHCRDSVTSPAEETR